MMKSNIKIGLVGIGLIIGTTCCTVALDKSDSTTEESTGAISYSARGRILEILGDGGYVKINHGPIYGFMESMEMSFGVRDTLQPGDLSSGDSVLFSLRVQPDGYFSIEKLTLVREN